MNDQTIHTLAGRSEFPTTRWTLVVAAGEPHRKEARSALVSLCEGYWYPLYAYSRRRGYPADRAQDLTAKRAGTHPKVLAALAARQVSESVGRMICRWTGQLPEKFRDESDELLIAAAAAGLGLRDLGAMFAEMYERARGDLPDEDPGRDFGDRGVRLETTFQGAGVLTGDLTPECAAVVGAVLDALSAPAGAEDTRTRDQRYHDALQEAMRYLRFCIVIWITSVLVGWPPFALSGLRPRQHAKANIPAEFPYVAGL